MESTKLFYNFGLGIIFVIWFAFMFLVLANVISMPYYISGGIIIAGGIGIYVLTSRKFQVKGKGMGNQHTPKK